MAIVAIIQARLGSTRLPNKILMDIGGAPMWQRVYEAAEKIRGVDAVVLAAPYIDSLTIAESYIGTKEPRIVGVPSGVATSDVLSRYLLVARKFAADPIIRITADCPMFDAEAASIVLTRYLEGGWDYVSNVWPEQNSTGPNTDGTDTEVFSYAALHRTSMEARNPMDREHVTRYMRNNPDKFRLRNVFEGLHIGRWSVDEGTDLDRARDLWASKYGAQEN